MQERELPIYKYEVSKVLAGDLGCRSCNFYPKKKSTIPTMSNIPIKNNPIFLSRGTFQIIPIKKSKNPPKIPKVVDPDGFLCHS